MMTSLSQKHFTAGQAAGDRDIAALASISFHRHVYTTGVAFAFISAALFILAWVITPFTKPYSHPTAKTTLTL